jgi:Uma2 family endonuclease
MVAASPLPLATAADLARLPPERRAEVINGEIVEKANPSAQHGFAQTVVVGELHGAYNRRGGGGAPPGGWWLMTEVEIELSRHEVYRPDILGWRRDRVPSRPVGRPVTVRPDWVCEVLSTSNARNDLVKKLRVYHLNEIPHYWIVDPEHETLTILRWTPDGYLTALTAGRGDRAPCEPFDAIQFPVGALFGDEE